MCIPPKVRESLFFLRGLLRGGKRNILRKIEKESHKDHLSWYAESEDGQYWSKAFKKLAIETDARGEVLADEFYNGSIEIIKENQKPQDQSVILICAAKNECENLKQIYEHYSKIGVDSFAFIDNNSSDDTVKTFLDYSNVNMYSAKDDYTSIRRQAWINRVMAHYGFEKWYLVIDSDEYLTYNQAEVHSINDVIDFCKARRINRMRALMVDMYPSKVVMNDEVVDFLKDFCFFDHDTYVTMKGKNELLLQGIQGGVRSRIFMKDGVNMPWLTKYPLVYHTRGDIQFQSHMAFPFYKNFQSDSYLVIRHYKFLPTDLKKYRERAQSGNFANGSGEYIQYTKEMEKGYVEFYDANHSMSFLNSESFYKISVMTEIPWNTL